MAIHYHELGEAARELVELIRDKGGAAVALAADLADEKAVSGLLPLAERELGPVGCLVNNAAVFIGRHRRDRNARESGIPYRS